MKNRYDILGDVARVYSNGKNKDLFFFIDKSDLNLISAHSWRIYSMNSTGYFRVESSITINYKTTHFGLGPFLLNAPKGKIVDHIDCDPTNNRRNNLRLATHAGNSRNVPKTRSKRSSIYKGVSWHKRKNKWVATCAINNRNKFLGYFDSEIDAAKSYDSSAKELHGEFALTNFR